MPVGSASSAEAVPDSGMMDSPSPSESSAGLTSDQILDQAFADSGSDEAQAPADDDATPTTPAQPVEAKAPEAKATPDEKAEPKTDLDERFAETAIPENWKAALKAIKAVDSAVGKQIQVEHYKLAQYQEVLPLEEARQLRSLFPSVESAQEARKASADIMALNYSLENDPDKFIGFIRERNPEAFARIAQDFPRTLYQSDPDFYRDTVAKPAVTHFLTHYASVAEQKGDELLKEAVAYIRDFDENSAKDYTAPKADPRDVRLSQYEARDRQQFEDGVKSFVTDIGRSYQGVLGDSITKAIEATGATGLSKEARKEVASRVTAEITAQLKQDSYIQNQVMLSARSGQRDTQHQQQVVDLLVSHARPLIGHAVKKNVAWITDNILGANRERIDKERKVASAKPVTAGSAPGSRGATDWSSMTAAQRRSMSPDAILEAAARGEL